MLAQRRRQVGENFNYITLRFVGLIQTHTMHNEYNHTSTHLWNKNMHTNSCPKIEMKIKFEVKLIRINI